MQDLGEPLGSSNSRAKNGYWKSGNETNCRQYKHLKAAGEGMIDRMRAHSNFFGNLPKYPLKTICNWFLTVREPTITLRRDISEVTHPIHWKFVKNETNMDKAFFLVNQKVFLRKAVGVWGTTCEKAMKMCTKDDQVRLAGILLMQSFRDRLDVIQDNRKSREVLDNRADMNKKACFEAAADAFRDESLTILHPDNWNEAVTKHGDGLDIEPNNPERIHLPWTGEDMQVIHSAFMKKYKATMKNWTKGTGGGPGAPEDYCNWETRDAAEYYKGYAERVGAGMEMTWIYMSDVKCGLPLYSSFKGLPEAAKMEDGVPGSNAKLATSRFIAELESIKKQDTMVTSALDKISDLLSRSLAPTETAPREDNESSIPRKRKSRPVIQILREVNEIESAIKEKKMKRTELKEKLKLPNGKVLNLRHSIKQIETDVIILTKTRDALMIEMNEVSGLDDDGYDKSLYFSDSDNDE